MSQIGPMLPAGYVSVVVFPTVIEFIQDPTDQRRAYLACIVSFHITDHIAVAEGMKNNSPVCEALRSGADHATEKAINVVQGICNGSKHAETRPGQQLQFKPGTDRWAPAFAWNTPGAGFGEGTWGGPERVVIDESQTIHSVRACLIGFLERLWAIYPHHLEGLNHPSTWR